MDPDTVLRLAHEQAMQYPSVEIDHPFGPDNTVYKVRGKMFMMAFQLRGIPSINLKIDPLDGEVLRDAYAEISPGYHMNKKHWITVAGAEVEADRDGTGDGDDDDGDGDGDVGGDHLDADLLHDLVLESYCLVVSKMPKKDRPVDPVTFGGRSDDG
ncbi:MmcQ/YjbR family DNA-binding protein [Brevibacterium spongiae]|uniref:MmcQ/YjbR family DNA-binding protein n=1 Tax=Brevibacterium spongiae TaxID=2909672 RepID=A0ABY5SME4_9MICO|nr:MmcQ/YjbR family DNA-binding protein [Brevibacterium spongiae]UVI35732.1 MmcQ/YjbR family DNA-binding protein [Brevibacterium spongiae]